MRARGALVVAVVGAALAPWAVADETPEPIVAYGFDHLLYEGKIAVSGGEPLQCTACHTVDAAGTIKGYPAHDACYGACHGDPPDRRATGRGAAKPYPIAAGRRRLCENCHSPTALDRIVEGSSERLGASYPPYSVDPDYGLVLSHPRHAAVTADGAACLTCHAVPTDAPAAAGSARPPHARCASCHAAPESTAVPAMDQCTACHLGAYGPAAAPHLETGPFSTRGAFSHRRHGARPGGDDCTACHAGVATTEGNTLPAPSKAECATCHDGDAAFSTIETRCTSCHAAAPELPRPRPARGPRFSHARHADRTAATCDACHALDDSGAPVAPGTDHAPCSDAGCHASEFGAMETTICTACHVGDEPWRPLHFDRRPRRTSEFGARFPHRTHLDGDTPLIAEPCGHCHRTSSGDLELRLPRDHTTCTGAGCHDRAGSSVGLRDSCEGCHVRDLVSQRSASRLAADWSVRARFRHAPHTEPCVTCHDSVIDSMSLADIGAPAKRACAACHDGQSAFKLTGHECARCHGT